MRALSKILFVLLIAPVISFAQGYPTKPLRVVAPFPPGGATDTLARAIAGEISKTLGQNVVVDNRPGAAGNIGATLVANAPPDGYTLLMGSTAHAINASLYKNLSYDILRDFSPLTQVATVYNVLVVNPSVPAHSVKELIAYARENPGRLNLGSSGIGSVGHLSGQMLKSMAHIDFVHVPYKGSSQVITDLISGRVQIAIESVLATLPHIRSGRLRPLGVSSTKRSPLLPDVPTMEEAGLPGFVSSGWSGVLAPAGVPKEVILKLNSHIVKAVNSQTVKERLRNQGAEPVGSTPEEFARFLKEDIARWAKLVRSSGASAQ